MDSHNHTHHDHSLSGNLTFKEKMIKRLEHWVRHNDDHGQTYVEWATMAKDNGMEDVGAFLDSAAEMTQAITREFEAALSKIKADT